MKQLKPLTIESAPEGSKDTLRGIQKSFGFIPNLLATLANAPATLNAFVAMEGAWGQQSTLSPIERHMILLTASVENHCNYCKAAHSTVLKGMMKVEASLVNAIREKKPLSDAKFNALVKFTRECVAERGYVSENVKNDFIGQGYTEAQMLEVVIGVALKTVTNYIDHLNPIEIEAAFKPEA